jgi:hypothetical protein
MNYSVEIGSAALMYVPSFIKIGTHAVVFPISLQQYKLGKHIM